MKSSPIVVFVCEHGAAKSIIAAAYLNRLARQRHLNVRAIGRGTVPEDNIPMNVIEGLQLDGLTPENPQPERLTPGDLAAAVRIIAFCDLPTRYHPQIPVEQWNDVPPVSQDYARAREVIVQHVSLLIDELAAVREV